MALVPVADSASFIAPVLTALGISFEVSRVGIGDVVLADRTSMVQAFAAAGGETRAYEAVMDRVRAAAPPDCRVWWGLRTDDVMGFDVYRKA